MNVENVYAVKWGCHKDTMMENLERMYSLNLYTDCVLSAENREIYAHKLVLSSCSSYFTTLFEKSCSKTPLFIFSNMTFEELRSIVDYMYRGQVTVCETMARRILKIGEELKIEGLFNFPKKNLPWGKKLGQSNGSTQRLLQINGSQNKMGQKNQNYLPTKQCTGFNKRNMDKSQNTLYAPDNCENDMMEAMLNQVVPTTSNGVQTPLPVLSQETLDLLSPQKIPDVPKRKKDDCFISPPIMRKKSGNARSQATTPEKTPETDGPEKILENTTQDDEENEEIEITMELSSIMDIFEGNETKIFTSPSLPAIRSASPLIPTVVASVSFSSETAESKDTSKIGTPPSRQENMNGDSGSNASSDNSETL